MASVRFQTIADIRTYAANAMHFGDNDDGAWFRRAVELIRDRIEYGRSYETDAEIAERDDEEHLDTQAIYEQALRDVDQGERLGLAGITSLDLVDEIAVAGGIEEVEIVTHDLADTGDPRRIAVVFRRQGRVAIQTNGNTIWGDLGGDRVYLDGDRDAVVHIHG